MSGRAGAIVRDEAQHVPWRTSGSVPRRACMLPKCLVMPRTAITGTLPFPPTPAESPGG